MNALRKSNLQKKRRAARVRARITGTAQRPRISVFRSNRYVWAQLIDDVANHTLIAAGDRGMKSSGSGRLAGAERVGELLAEKAKEREITQAVFDRGKNRYHGIVRAIAEGARKGGLKC